MSQNGSRNREKGMPKIMPKFDTAKGKVFRRSGGMRGGAGGELKGGFQELGTGFWKEFGLDTNII